MRHAHGLSIVLVIGAFCGVTACNKEQRATAESAARTALSVIDVDMGRHVDLDKKITDKTDDFAPSDTIYASVHMSGSANNGDVVGRWTFEDGTIVDETTGFGPRDVATREVRQPGRATRELLHPSSAGNRRTRARPRETVLA